MKNIILALFIMIGVVSFANTKNTHSNLNGNSEFLSNILSVKEANDFLNLQLVKDCTITIKGTFDGVEVDLEITISDTSTLECLWLKARVKALELIKAN